MTAIYTTQEGLEVLSDADQSTLNLVTTQVGLEVLSSNDGSSNTTNYFRVTQQTIEVLSQDTVNSLLTQVVLEVLSDANDYVPPDYPVWPFAPSVDFSETKEYLTDINFAVSKEERFVLRDTPRTILKYNYRLRNAREYAAATARAAKYANSALYIPLWSDGIPFFNIAANTIQFLFDTTLCELTIDSYIIFWTSWEVWEVGQIAAITAEGITLKQPLGVSKDKCWLFPLLAGYPSNGINIVSDENHVYTCDLEITCAICNYNPLVPDNVYQSFLDHPIITTFTIVTGNITDQLLFNAETVSVETGQFQPLKLEDYLRRRLAVRMKASTREELYILRRSFDYLAGKYNVFWLPTFHEDIIPISSTITAYRNSIQVKNTPVFITLPNAGVGPSFYLLIIGDSFKPITVGSWSIDEGGETVTLNLIKDHETDSYCISKTIKNIRMISFIHLSRLDSDSIEYVHGNYGFTMVNSVTVSVSNE